MKNIGSLTELSNNDVSEDQIKELTLKRPNILKWTEDKEIRKIIIVKGKIINIVV